MSLERSDVEGKWIGRPTRWKLVGRERAAAGVRGARDVVRGGGPQGGGLVSGQPTPLQGTHAELGVHSKEATRRTAMHVGRERTDAPATASLQGAVLVTTSSH